MFGLNFKRQGRFADLFLKNLNQRDLSDNWIEPNVLIKTDMWINVHIVKFQFTHDKFVIFQTWSRLIDSRNGNRVHPTVTEDGSGPPSRYGK